MTAGIVYDTNSTDGSNTSFAGFSTALNVMKPSDARAFAQNWQGATKRFLSDLGATATVTGTTALAVTLNQAFTAYGTSTGQIPNGAVIAIKPPNACSGATTLNINTIGTKAIRFDGDTDVRTGAWDANATILLRYDTAYNSAAGAWALLNPSTNSGSSLYGRPLPTIANNGSDATNDIDFSAGAASDLSTTATGLMWVACAALTKQLDANWAAGTNQGMRYSGAAIANTTYHLWACWTDAGVQDYYADPSATQATVLGHLQAETGGSAYTHIRRVASIVRTGGTIRAFIQRGDEFIWTAVTATDVTASNPGTSAATRAISVPTGINVLARLNVLISNIGSGVLFTVYMTSMLQTDLSDDFSVGRNTFPNAENVSGRPIDFGAPISIMTDTSAQVRSRCSASDANCTLRITATGYADTRGRS
jgi:hypothetical protein